MTEQRNNSGRMSLKRLVSKGMNESMFLQILLVEYGRGILWDRMLLWRLFQGHIDLSLSKRRRAGG